MDSEEMQEMEFTECGDPCHRRGGRETPWVVPRVLIQVTNGQWFLSS